MQRRNMLAPERRGRQLAELRQEVLANNLAVRPRRGRLAANQNMFLQIPGREFGHRRAARQLRRQRLGNGVPLRLDAVDNLRRPAARLIGGDDPVRPTVTRFWPSGPRLCTT